MRSGLLGLIGAGLFGATTLFAQTPPGPFYAGSAQPMPVGPRQATTNSRPNMEWEQPTLDPDRPHIVELQPNQDVSRFWFRTEYLLWWVKDAQLPVPIVTTGDPTVGLNVPVNTAGAIGSPGTTVLHGGNSAGFGAFSGFRFVFGGWATVEQQIGWEAGGFLLERRTNVFTAASDEFGNPPLYFPAFNVTAGQERALPIADPLRGFAGEVFVGSTLEFWGAEFSGLLALYRRPGFEVVALGGFRYADLKENLHIANNTTDLMLLSVDSANDYFDTRNQFYGGQVGTRVSWHDEFWTFDVTGKLAIGSTHQVVNISGDFTQVALPGGLAPTPGTFNSGIYTQTSNIGRRTESQFGVLPSLEAKVACQLTPRLRLSVGYDFIYWNQVVRPGNQMDRNINQTQSPVFAGGVLIGPANPAPLFNRTDLWAHGVNMGLELRY